MSRVLVMTKQLECSMGWVEEMTSEYYCESCVGHD